MFPSASSFSILVLFWSIDLNSVGFVPSEDGSDREDNDADTYYDSGIHSLVEENPYGRSAKPWPLKRVLGPTPVQAFVEIAFSRTLI